jgi:transcriptional regulator with XRE-family HTH domain
MNPDQSPAAGETIGQRLKRLRLERGLSQRELAAPGVSYAYISRIEAGTRQPSVKALRKLATKLGISADYLETGSDLDSADARELRLADLELALRLGEPADADALREIVAEAGAAGDRSSVLRARSALAAVAHDRGDYDEAVTLLETAITSEPFDPISLVDIYSQLARAYHGAGKTRAAVELFERCLAEVADGDDAALEARYATLLSYALSDVGEIARAEEVVQRALDRVKDSEDPYTRVRLYWSMARLAHAEGRSSFALTNVRKAIALLQATEDTVHLARAHLLAASITLSRDDAGAAERHLDQAEQFFGASAVAEDVIEIKIRRSKIATLQGRADDAVALARDALTLAPEGSAYDQGLGHSVLADALALRGEIDPADEAYSRAVELLEAQGRWRDATSACRAWAHMLREQNRDQQALDVLDRAAELGVRASPDVARIER